MWHWKRVILVTAPQLSGRRNSSMSVNSSFGLVLRAKIPPSHPVYPLPPSLDTPSPCAVWRQLQWAPDVAWHPSSHGTGCGLKVVWKHHPPADPMKVPQTTERGFSITGSCLCGLKERRSSAALGTNIYQRPRGSASRMCMCYLLNMLWISKYMRQ